MAKPKQGTKAAVQQPVEIGPAILPQGEITAVETDDVPTFVLRADKRSHLVALVDVSRTLYALGDDADLEKAKAAIRAFELYEEAHRG